MKLSIQSILSKAQAARDEGQWLRAVELYTQLSASDPHSAELQHNLGLSLLGLGKPQEALLHCAHALELNPSFWQSDMIMSKAYQQLDQITKAHHSLKSVLKSDYKNAPARLGLADLALNQYGDPYGATAWVRQIDDPEYVMDVKLTSMMAKLYDRPNWHDPKSAILLTEEIKSFSAEYLRLPNLQLPPLVARSTAKSQRNPAVRMRPRVGLLSPLFSASPVYFLTFSKWKKMAKHCDLILFNRGHKADWATAAFKDLGSEWLDVQHMSAEDLARSLHKADLDVLYDLGGWMDPVGLKALSVKPARQLYKWVGGQSVTTGLTTFDGWVGDEANSPIALQHLYTESLLHIKGGYTSYVVPDYLPKPAAKKSKAPCIFSNPAKVSQAFLERLSTMPGKKVFIHRQYRHPQVQERILAGLGKQAKNAEFIFPGTHQEALETVNAHATMIDTFPYSSGLTAREALAMGTKIQVLEVGSLFCERHTAYVA